MMFKILNALQSAKSVLLRVAETGLALIGFIVVVYLLLGEDAGPYVLSVITNISLFMSAVTSEAILGIAIIVALVFFLRKKT